MLCAFLFVQAPLLETMAAPNIQQTRSQAAATTVSSLDLDNEIHGFLDREFAAHVADIKSLDPPQDRVVGALTTGSFPGARLCALWPLIRNYPARKPSQAMMSPL